MKQRKKKTVRFEQILLLGCDVNTTPIFEDTATEEDRCQRSDIIVVLSLDRVRRKIALIDLMRDIWVSIPGHGMGKLNDAVVYGGPELAVQVINDHFHLCIRKYIRISVNGLVDLIDLFGGVDVKLSEEEAEYINEWMPNVNFITERDADVPPITSAGMNHLNGMQTLAHVRNRTIGYIEGRENRTNDVLKSMARKAKKEMSAQECLRFALQARNYVTTNLNATDIVSLLQFGLHYDPEMIATYHAPAEGTYEVKNDFTWRMEVDFEKASQKLWHYLKHLNEKKNSPVTVYKRRAAMADFCYLKDVSDQFIVCLLLLEDDVFFRHKGIDFRETVRAIRMLLHGHSLYGGSTITQQLVKNLYFRFDASLSRKVKEAFLAYSFERALTKRQILELYMNIVYFDNGQYGIYNASRFYFNKSQKELNLNQSFFLAALLPVVGIYNPLYHPEKFAQYRDRKLDGQKDFFKGELLAEITRHGADLLDEELCKASEETKQYDGPGPVVNERFGPGGADHLII